MDKIVEYINLFSAVALNMNKNGRPYIRCSDINNYHSLPRHFNFLILQK